MDKNDLVCENIDLKEYNKLKLLYEFKTIENEYLMQNSKELRMVRNTILYRPYKVVAYFVSKVRNFIKKILRFMRRIASKCIRMMRRAK